jgi:hypothetical protein
MESALNSLKVDQKESRVEVSASIPRGLVEKMFETPMEPETGTSGQPAPSPKKKHRRKP